MFDSLDHLDILKVNEIVDSLNENGRWRILVQTLRSFRVELKDAQLRQWERKDSPAVELLDELKMRCCTIAGFKIMLQEANLLETLAIIAEPEPLEIVEHPAGDVDCHQHQQSSEKCQHIHRDSELVLKCRATGMPPPKYQWHRANSPLDGRTSPELKIDHFTLDDEGEYWCQVSHTTKEGKEECRLSDIVVCKVIHTLPKKITAFIIPKQGKPFSPTDPVELKGGETLHFGVLVDCDMPYTLQWHKDNVVLREQTSETLRITNATPEHSGKYFCLATNEAGDVSSSAIEVKVSYPPYSKVPATSKVALLIGNSNYKNQKPLEASSNDIVRFAQNLERVDFEVIALENLSLEEMRKAIDGFFELLSPGSYAVFCFIGHGFHYNKRDYMMPVDCHVLDDEHPLNSTSGLCDDILDQKAGQLGLALIVMDMCRKKQQCSFSADENKNVEVQDEPETESTSRPHIMRLYSTSENQSAYEYSGRQNGFYIPFLCEYIFQDKPIYDAVGDANRSFQNHPLAKKQTPAMKAQGINYMKLTDPSVHKVPIVLKPYSVPGLPFPICFNPHRRYICNAMDVTYRYPFKIDFELPEELEYTELPETAENGIRGITIFNLQRAKGGFPVTLSWREGATSEPRRLRLQLQGTLQGPAKDKIF